ncbi:MAG: cupredoxin domain-containing protein [Terriglobales bacterium]
MTRIFFTFVLVATLIASAACATSAASPGKSDQAITIDNFTFSPAVLTVAAATTVTWTNHDDIPHSVVSTSHKFKSHALDTNDTFAYTFTEPGTYEYFCGLHPKMVGKVIVTAKK